MQLKYLHINSYAFNSDQLIEICPMDSDNLHYLGLHFSSSEFLPSVLLKIAENTLK